MALKNWMRGKMVLELRRILEFFTSPRVLLHSNRLLRLIQGWSSEFSQIPDTHGGQSLVFSARSESVGILQTDASDCLFIPNPRRGVFQW